MIAYRCPVCGGNKFIRVTWSKLLDGHGYWGSSPVARYCFGCKNNVIPLVIEVEDEIKM